MPGGILLTTKLSIPPLRADYVPRPRLVARLNEGLAHKLTVLSAPAGFGKTTLLCEWLKESQLRSAWVSLDDGDNDHGRFISYVMAALGTLNTGLEEHIQAISQAAAQGVPLESPMAVLINDFAAMPREAPPVVLVLDDYHSIHNPAIHTSMAFALDYLPDNVHIVIASRTQPPLRLSQLRTRGLLSEFRAPDLRFSRSEVEYFLIQSAGLQLSTAQVAALDDRTEGWVAGLQLAVLAMSGRTDIDRFLHDFAGSHRYILDYLGDEVFSQQSPEVCDFLLKTSILEQLNPELCNAVTGNENGRSMLNYLERENLFVVPLDDQGQWYRYYHLFAGLLKNRSEQLSGKERFSLHRRAALWFDANNQPYDAIEHALAAHEYGLAIGMMVKATPLLAMRLEMNRMMKWLEALPREISLSHPSVPLMFAWAHFFMADIEAVEPYLRDALSSMNIDDTLDENWPEDLPPQAGEILAQVFALRTFVAVNHGDPEHGIRLARKALMELPPGDLMGRFAIMAALGDAYRDFDHFAAASQAYSEALAISKSIGQFVASQTMRMDLARLRFKMGQLRHAETICRDVLASSDERYHLLFPVAQAHTLLGEIQRERNELDAAELTLNNSIRQCKLAGYQRYLVLSLISLAQIELARGNKTAAEQSLEAARSAAVTSGSGTLHLWVEQYQMRLLRNGEANWLADHPLEVDKEIVFQREDETLTLVRLHISRARHSRPADLQVVCQLLERMLASAQKSSRTGSAIEILLLQALALHQLGQTPEAIHKIHQSLSLAEPEGFVRLFVDEGEPVAELLMLAVQNNLCSEYASRLLKLVAGSQPKHEGLSEALTEREAEVLRLLAAGLSNLEIAEALVISVSTIKTHITRIYSKLDVNSRTQAIIRARELKII